MPAFPGAHTGVLFDFNGTLVDDTPLQRRAWEELLLRQFGHRLTGLEFSLLVKGRGNRSIIRHFGGPEMDDDACDALAGQKEDAYRRLCTEALLRLAPGATGLLEELNERGIPAAIATASPKPNVDFYIRRFGLARFLDTRCIIYDDGSFPPKPAPDIFLKAAAAIGVPPGRCIAFEDSAAGILAAQQAGVGTLVAVVLPGGGTPTWPTDSPELADTITNFHEFNRLFLRGLAC